MSENGVKRRGEREGVKREHQPTEKMEIIERRELDKNNTDRGPI